MELKIKSINNGFLVSWVEDWSSEENKDIRQQQEAIVGEDDKELLKNLFEFIAGHAGYIYDRFSKDNLNITFDKKGHKFD